MQTSRKELKSNYKSAGTPAGVFQIRNLVNGKIFIGTAQNIPGIINSSRFQLTAGTHHNSGLQAEWRQFGPEAFVFETLDELTVNGDSPINVRTELTQLEELWLEKLQPYGDRGYHDRPK
jgi:hypothetical protein